MEGELLEEVFVLLLFVNFKNVLIKLVFEWEKFEIFDEEKIEEEEKFIEKKE